MPPRNGPLTLAAIEADEALPSSPHAPPLSFQWFDQIEPCLDANWMVERVLPARGVALMFGHPGSGKSFLAADIAWHVAAGRQWRGLNTRAGLVIYLAAEGASGLRNRFAALRETHDSDSVPLILISDAIDLQSADGDMERLASTVEVASNKSMRAPSLIIVDTLSKTFGAGKENSDDMSSYVANMERLAARFDCCVMPVHHRPKDSESTDPRGHSSLRGGVGTILLVEGGETKRATVTKQKDGPEGEHFAFKLKQVEIGTDKRGEPVTTCVVEHIEAPTALPVDPKGRAIARLKGNAALTYRLIGQAIEDGGVPIPEDIPDSTINRLMTARVVRLGQVSDNLLAGLRTSSDNSSDMKEDSARRAFDRARKALQAADLLGMWGDYMWLK